MNKKQLEQLRREHEKFLRKMGAHPDQIKARKATSKSKLPAKFAGVADAYFEKKPLADVLQGDTSSCTKHDLMSNIYKLSEKDQRSIKRRATQVGVLVNKSGYGVITPGMDPKTLGRK
jgi:hypothetical protein